MAALFGGMLTAIGTVYDRLPMGTMVIIR